MLNPPTTSTEPKKQYLIVIDKRGTKLLAEVNPDPVDTEVLVVRYFYNSIVWSFRHIADPAPDTLIASLSDQIVGIYDERSESNHLKDRMARGHRVYPASYEPYTHE